MKHIEHGIIPDAVVHLLIGERPDRVIPLQAERVVTSLVNLQEEAPAPHSVGHPRIDEYDIALLHGYPMQAVKHAGHILFIK